MSQKAVFTVAVIYDDDVASDSPLRLRQFEKEIALNNSGSSVVRHVVARIDNLAVGRSNNLSAPAEKVFVLFPVGANDLIARAEADDVISILLAPFALVLFVEIV